MSQIDTISALAPVIVLCRIDEKALPGIIFCTVPWAIRRHYATPSQMHTECDRNVSYSQRPRSFYHRFLWWKFMKYSYLFPMSTRATMCDTIITTRNQFVGGQVVYYHIFLEQQFCSPKLMYLLDMACASK